MDPPFPGSKKKNDEDNRMRKKTVHVLFLISITLPIFSQTNRGIQGITPSDFDHETRTALVIGNAAYMTAPLKNPINDARLMAEALRRLGFSVLVGENLTYQQMEEKVLDFGRKIKRGGVGLFYFSGHGVQVQDANYLIPVDAAIEKEQDVRFEAMLADRVLAEMEAAENRLNIVIFDACRDNPFARSFRSQTRGLAQMSAPKGTIIEYATAKGAVASDGTGVNGLFTEQLIRYMNEPGQKIEEVFKKVRSEVCRISGGLQVPWESSNLLGDFYFIRQAAIQSGPVVPVSSNANMNPTPDGGDDARVTPIIASWNAWQDKMTTAYKNAEEQDKKEGLPKIRKALIWNDFIEVYSMDNPYSQDDEVMRSNARIKKQYWIDERTAYHEQVVPDTLLKYLPEMIDVKSGKFSMGANCPTYVGTWGNLVGPDCDYQPIHEVTLDSFYIGKFEVTAEQYCMFLNATNVSDVESDRLLDIKNKYCYIINENNKYIPKKKHGHFPALAISWFGAESYCKWADGRLPTEAEWEYAARGGILHGKNYRFSGSSDADHVAWYYSNAGTRPFEVGLLKPNQLGIHDMSGSAWEWCSDWYDKKYYQISELKNPGGPSSSKQRIIRGGSWKSMNVDYCQVFYRDKKDPDIANEQIGFRLARSVK